MCGWPLLVLWALLPATAAGSPGRSYPHRVVLDPEEKYWLHWGRQGERLAFRLEVRTNGYVGFGFSPTGTMAAADIVVGGVAHGQPYLQVSSGPFRELPALGSPWEVDGQRSPSKGEADTGSAQQSPSDFFCHLLPQGHPSLPWGPCLWHLQSSPGEVYLLGKFASWFPTSPTIAQRPHIPLHPIKKNRPQLWRPNRSDLCALACLRLGIAENLQWLVLGASQEQRQHLLEHARDE